MVIIGLSTILSAQLFINEIDYDQPSTDASEFIELSGPAGSYSNVNLILINGNNNSEYGSYNLGTVSLNDESQGYGFYVIGTSSIPNVDFTSGFPSTNAIQNGNPDGVELWVNGQLIDAVSYAGTMNDSEGGTMEEATPNDSDDEFWEGGEGLSIGRLGVDSSPWTVMTNSPGTINDGQSLDASADFPPNANAGEDVVVESGDLVTLDGSLSSDFDGSIVSFVWEQTAGPNVDLSSDSEAVVTFEVPNVTETTTWTFELTVVDDGNNFDSDEVNVTVYILDNISIYDIQYSTDGTGISPYVDQLVSTTGIATAVGDYYYWLQDGEGAWNGIYIYAEDNHGVQLGDEVTVVGTVAESYEKTQIGYLTEQVVHSNSNALPNALSISTTEANMEMYEGVLVSVMNAECTNPDLGYGEWEVNDGTGACRIDDKMYAFIPEQGQFYNVTGPLDYSYDNYKIEPRDEGDVSIYVMEGMPVANAGGDQSVSPGTVVTIDGSGSYDSNGSIIAYEWVQIGGTPVILDDEENPTTFFTAPDASDIITFRLTVWDDEINEATDEISIYVVGQTTIYDIQYTVDQGEYCYETPMVGQTVLTSGVVTAVKPGDYPNFFFQDPSLESWAGIYVYDTSINPQIGDEISLTATVNEYYSFTQLIDVTSFETLSTGNYIAPISLETNEIGTSCSLEGEMLESMLVTVSNVSVEGLDEYNWYLNDGSGTAILDDYYFDGSFPTINVGDTFECITGVVTYSYSEFKISPRNIDDFSCNVEECNPTGDVNIDGFVNVQDIVMIVNHIIDTSQITDSEALCNADLNGDGIVNVLDIISVVNLIIG